MNDAFTAQLLRFPAHLVIDQFSIFEGALSRDFNANREQEGFFGASAFAGERTQSC